MNHQSSHPQPASPEESRRVAEAARETSWNKPGFLRELFLGRLRMDLLFPFPEPKGIDRPEFQAFYTQLEALLREVQEEAGLLANIEAYLGTAAEYFYNPDSQGYVNKIGHFFLISPYEQDLSLKVEEDHTLVWLPLAQAYPLMYHDIYRWALDEAAGQRIK